MQIWREILWVPCRLRMVRMSQGQSSLPRASLEPPFRVSWGGREASVSFGQVYKTRMRGRKDFLPQGGHELKGFARRVE